MGGKITMEDENVTPVPKWLQVRYGQLWDKFAHTSFTIEQAREVLDETREVVTVILSRLRKSGWLAVKFDNEDFRRRHYQLINPSDLFRKIRKEDEVKNAQNNKD